MEDAEVFYQAFQKAKAAGDTDNARKFAEAYVAASKSSKTENWYDKPREVLQGMTLGAADEIGSALAAIPAGIATGTNPVDAYRDMQQSVDAEQRAYQAENPGTSMLLQGAGALATGGMGGARALPALAPKLGLARATALIGAAEGGVYGAASAKQGERLKGGATGAAIGAVAAPVAGWAGQKVANGIGSVAGGIKNALLETPDAAASRILRSQVGDVPVDELVRRSANLGPKGTLMDVDPNLAKVARAARDIPGPFARRVEGQLEARQMGSAGRLSEAAQQAAGARADDFRGAVAQIKAERSAKAGPLYEQAWTEGNQAIAAMQQAGEAAKRSGAQIGPSDRLSDILSRPSVASAMKRGVRIARDLGDDPKDNVLKTMHYAKMALDAQIEPLIRSGARTKARSLIAAKNELLGLMDEVSPSYKQARDIFAGDSALLDAAKSGREFLKVDPEDLADLVAGMSQSERQLYRLGAVKAIVSKLDDTEFTHDAARKLINRKSLQARLATIFDSPDQAEGFIRSAVAERRMTATRQTVLGGSQTSGNLQAGKALQQGVQPSEAVSALTNPKVAAGISLVKAIFGTRSVSPEVLDSVANRLLAEGLTEAEIRQIFATPAIQQYTSRLGPVVNNAIRGAAAPVAVNAFAQ